MSGSFRLSLTTVILSRDMDVLLGLCLTHLAQAAAAAGLDRHRIVVVDNASRRPLAPVMADCPAYEVIRLDTHHGFGAACNLGARRWPGDLFLFLNNDVFLLGDCMTGMVRAFETNPDVGICGSRLLFPDGTIQHAGVLMSGPPTGPYHVGRKRAPEAVSDARERFQAVTGACMMVRRDVFDELGGFDPFFEGFGYEDVDLCLRAGQRGYGVHCVQTSRSLHFESMTPGRVEFASPSLELFFKRWDGRYTIDG
jgi:GT2 family glycosyltransferase